MISDDFIYDKDQLDLEVLNTVAGTGSYGTVYIVNAKKDKNEKYALKIINHMTYKEQNDFLREILILYQLDHPAILKYKGANIFSIHDQSVIKPSILTEYMPNGSLAIIIENEKKFNPTEKYILLLGISNAMKYLHNNKVIHRDLKLENILLDNNYYPHICDFGLAKCFPESIDNDKILNMSSPKGTPLYMAPELSENPFKYTNKVDVYAFGMVVYSIVTEQRPSYSFNTDIIIGKRPKLDETIPNKMKNLIYKCCNKNPKDRPTFDAIYEELKCNIQNSGYFNKKLDDIKINSYIHILESSNKKSDTEYSHDLCYALNYLTNNIKDTNEAIQFLSKLSKNGNGYSSFLLGLLYEKGIGIETDTKQSIQYQKLAIKQQNFFGYYNLGHIYLKEGKYDKSIEYFYKAASKGIFQSYYYLGYLYEMKEDYQMAREYYLRAISYDNHDHNALFQLGNLYLYGKCGTVEIDKAKECFEKSAKFGNILANACIAYLYYNGLGVTNDINKAIKYFEIAAKHKDLNSIKNLGFIYESIDINKAINYYKKAKSLGCKGLEAKIEDLTKKVESQ